MSFLSTVLAKIFTGAVFKALFVWWISWRARRRVKEEITGDEHRRQAEGEEWARDDAENRNSDPDRDPVIGVRPDAPEVRPVRPRARNVPAQRKALRRRLRSKRRNP